MNIDFGRLRWRLLLGDLVVAGAGCLTAALAVRLTAPQAFETAMMGRAGPSAMGSLMESLVTAALGDALSSALVVGVGAATVVAILVAIYVSSQLAHPISELVDASRLVAKGDYARHVEVGSGELGELAASFNQMAASLEATERRRRELIGDVAHELRTPITSLTGYIEGLEQGVFEPGPDTWRILGDEASRLARVVDDLSELWRAEAQDIAFVLEDLDGPTVVRDAVQRHRAAAAARQIDLDAVVDRPVNPRADRARLAQVVDNLVANAIRYTPEGGRVRIRLAALGSDVRIDVTDTGRGLTGEQLEHVFERFYRADPSRSREAGGSGLGLAIAKALIEAMGGRIWATSPGQGQGATFGIDLPAASTSGRSHWG